MHVRTDGHHGFGSKLFNGELSEEDLKDHLKKLHAYLDILEKDIENI